nr:hypothetical protein [Paracoccus saliphilus]
MRHDFQNIPEDAEIILHPADANLIHREPVKAMRIADYFYCEGSDAERCGASYHLGDVAAFCRGWEMAEVAA